MSDEQRRHELAEFLRTRRTRISPEQVGLFGGGRRRTPGLRREEVAHLAHVGVSWYTLLEQGRDIRPSRAVLQSIADALQLSPVERQHMFVLADQGPLPADLPEEDEEISPALQRMLDALDPLPAYVMNARWNYLAGNRAAVEVLRIQRSTTPYGNNAIWRIFTDPESRAIHPHTWEQVAQKVLAEFRADSTPYMHEPWLQRLIADLQDASPEFRAWWPQHDIRAKSDSIKHIIHPLAGELKFEHTILQAVAAPGLKLMVYTPLPGTDTLERLQQLLGVGEPLGV
ncbi:helix-turn-helix domain-containing protein [Chloroflexia bacterium SDU3-3]|nr:helix-turn-helix domain-containing protein [Chloroflexia bacterium SDU3-3]